MKLSAYQVYALDAEAVPAFPGTYAGEVFVDGASDGDDWFVFVGKCSAGWFVFRPGPDDYVPIAFQTRHEAAAWLKFSHAVRAPLMLTRETT